MSIAIRNSNESNYQVSRQGADKLQAEMESHQQQVE